MQKTCTHCGDTEGKDTFAMAMLKSYHKQATRWYIIAIVILSMWLATIGGFVYYLSLYDFSSETITVEQDSTDGGNANYIGGNGDIANGETENS